MPLTVETYFPGLRQQIDFTRGRRFAPVTLIINTSTTALPAPGQASKPPLAKKAVYEFIDPENALFTKRLNKSLIRHRRKSINVKLDKQKDGTNFARCDRARCIV